MINKLRSTKVADLLHALSVFDLLVILMLIIIPTAALAARGGSEKSKKGDRGSTTAESPVKIDSISPIAGPAGTEITIIGSGFADNNNIILKGKTIGSGIPSLDGTIIKFVLPNNLPCKPPKACPVQVEVDNEKGLSNAFPFKITFEDVIFPLEITTDSLPDGFINVSYEANILAEGGIQPYSWTVIDGLLPAGLRLDVSAAVISGTPTTAGAYTFTVQVNDSDKNVANRQYTVSINTMASVTIKGRFVDYFTSEPIPNFPILKTTHSIDEDIPSAADADGNFSMTFTLSDMSEGDGKNVLLGLNTCYRYGSTMGVKSIPSTTTLTSGNKGLIIYTHLFDLENDWVQWEITSGVMDLGDIAIWPATKLDMDFDRAVKVKINFSEDGTAYLSTGYLSDNYVTTTRGEVYQNYLPYEYPLKIEVTDSNGNTFVSPETVHTQIVDTCNPLTGSFANGVFTFE